MIKMFYIKGEVQGAWELGIPFENGKEDRKQIQHM